MSQTKKENLFLPQTVSCQVTEIAQETYQTYANQPDEVLVSISDFITVNPIRKLRTKEMNKFVSCEAVVTKRTQVFNRLDKLFLTCNACFAVNGPYARNEEGTAWPANLQCIDCSAKSFQINVEKTRYKNYQKVSWLLGLSEQCDVIGS